PEPALSASGFDRGMGGHVRNFVESASRRTTGRRTHRFCSLPASPQGNFALYDSGAHSAGRLLLDGLAGVGSITAPERHAPSRRTRMAGHREGTPPARDVRAADAPRHLLLFTAFAGRRAAVAGRSRTKDRRVSRPPAPAPLG